VSAAGSWVSGQFGLVELLAIGVFEEVVINLVPGHEQDCNATWNEDLTHIHRAQYKFIRDWYYFDSTGTDKATPSRGSV